MKGIATMMTFCVLSASALAACQSSRVPQTSLVQPSAAPAERGISAPTPIVLAEGVLPPAPIGQRAWVADEVTLGQQRAVTHRHEGAFVYAPVTPSRLTVAGRTRTLRPGEAVFVGDNVQHTHDVTCMVPSDCRDSFWEIRLAQPGAPPPAGDDQTRRVFVSPTFNAFSADAAARVRLELVQIPPGAVVGLSGSDTRYLYIPRNVPGNDVASTALSGPDRLVAGEGLLVLPQAPVTASNHGRAPVAVLALRTAH
jgi:hypothetical protein